MKIPDDMTDRWPRFELEIFQEPTGIPNEWDAELLAKGAPKGLVGGRYKALSGLTLLEVPNYGPLVRFGSHMLCGAVCLDPRSGAIVDIGYVETETAYLPRGFIGSPSLVNSSLDQFITSVRAVIARFPYDSGEYNSDDVPDEVIDRFWDECDRAVGEMREALRRIDPVAIYVDGFWETFLDDVQMGDFSTARIFRNTET